MYYSNLYRIFERKWSGVGIIFTLHHINPDSSVDGFTPNGILDLSPDFLDTTIQQLIDHKYEIITLDELALRLDRRQFSSKFACFTLDDGYLDSYQYALPVFSKYDAPFTIYIATGFCDGTGVHWWQHLEDVISDNDHIELNADNKTFSYPSRTLREKMHAYNSIYWSIRAADHPTQQAVINQLVDQYNINIAEFCNKTTLSWDMVRELSRNKLVTIGAHTVNHYPLGKLSAVEVRNEAERSRKLINYQLGYSPIHFAYPYGDKSSAGPREFQIMKDLGFATATTTRKGVIFPEHAHHMHALPRISLNGHFQKPRYIPVYLSGTPFALWNRLRHLDVN